MSRFRQILLDVWREACRHIEISESASSIASLLSQQMPVHRFIVRRLDEEHQALVTMADAVTRGVPEPIGERVELSGEEFAQVQRWCRGNRLLRRGQRLTGTLALVAPSTSADLLAIPLSLQSQPLGLLLVLAPEKKSFDDSHAALLEALREPLSVALENDRRVHEMARLREAAEADRGNLLRRLGRTDLGEIVVGENSGLRPVMDRVNLVAGSDVPVLILGETGTGKELVARAIHTRSARSRGPFIRVNCGAIPSELIDSQLFGHERGSFTGASQSRQGWFERADGGTLLLDEIGELPLDAQVRFLRVLQDGFVERVGGTQPIHVDVRIIAATHRDLAQMVRESRFREDLWYRLAVFPILLPPLRERRDDIRELAHHFAERAAMRFGLAATEPTEDDVGLLQAYDWPGNIRELGAVIDRAAILGDGRALEVAKALGFTRDTRPLPLSFQPAPSQAASALPGSSSPHAVPPHTDVRGSVASSDAIVSLDEAMKAHIQRALQATGGRIEGKRGAAALLEINPHTLRARMRKLKIQWSDFRE
jgi:transcriptional regulator with GAF, ATPase, and Fis domain